MRHSNPDNLDILVQIVSICEAIVKLLSLVTPSILTESTQFLYRQYSIERVAWIGFFFFGDNR